MWSPDPKISKGSYRRLATHIWCQVKSPWCLFQADSPRTSVVMVSYEYRLPPRVVVADWYKDLWCCRNRCISSSADSPSVTDPRNRIKSESEELLSGMGKRGTWWPRPRDALDFSGMMRISLVLSSPRSLDSMCCWISFVPSLLGTNTANEGCGIDPWLLFVSTTGGGLVRYS